MTYESLIDFYETLCQPEWLYFVSEGSSRSRSDFSRTFTRSAIVRSLVGRNLGLVLIMCLGIFVMSRVKLFTVHLLRFVLCSSLWLVLFVCSEGGVTVG